MTKQSTESREIDLVESLRVLLALAFLVILVLIYFMWNPDDTNRLGRLVVEAIPSAVVMLVAVAFVYYFFRRHRIRLGDELQNSLDTRDLAGRLAEHLTTLEAVPPDVMSWASFLSALESLRSRILEDSRFKPEAVVSIGRSGAIAGALLAGNLGGLEHYGLDRLHTFRQGERTTTIVPNCEALRPRLEGRQTLVVMAECITGGTLKLARNELARVVGAGSLRTAAVLRSENAGFRPDYIGQTHEGKRLVFRSSWWKRHSIAPNP